ncbi:alginate lyase family protein [Sphingomonas suaedae]|uniref:Alginate lyase family protein n=1 Tax=Sphingomonas suaedae TaxID=2599297 RepID=A0A518RCG2_9SPHN|nr:alginate lyase family protein [Sphingomonas suaedae]QDX25143.1 alginate lyase family protein [Sphingomonas suaedae]
MPGPSIASLVRALAIGSVLSMASPVATAATPALARCNGAEGYLASGQRTFLWRPEWLAMQRQAIAGDAALRARLVRSADAALRRGPYSVTDKPAAAGSGDKRDYLSIGPYWWPDPSKPSGEPYLRRDGRVNPERNGERFDAQRLGAFARDVETLALAWHVTGDRRYAEHAAKLLRTWFVAPATRMNPNLDYAQAVPGKSAGRPEGIIEATRLVPVIEAIGVLGPSRAIGAEDQRAIEKWFADFATWMATSPNGTGERAAKNNHGIYYDMLLGQFALFARMDKVTQRLAQEFATRRLAPQIDAEGTLPAETARTRSWHYSAFTLRAAVQMAMLGECVGVDLWQGDERANPLRRAVSYLAGYRTRLDDWPFKDIDLSNPQRRDRALRESDTMLEMASWGFRDARFAPPQGPVDTLWLAPYPR